MISAALPSSAHLLEKVPTQQVHTTTTQQNRLHCVGVMHTYVPQVWLNHCSPSQSFATHSTPDCSGSTSLTSPWSAECLFSPSHF